MKSPIKLLIGLSLFFVLGLYVYNALSIRNLSPKKEEQKEEKSIPIAGPMGYNGHGGYLRDSSGVFYLTESSPCPTAGCRALIPGADPATFVGTEHEYAKDKNHVYLPDQWGNIRILPMADPATFSFIGYNTEADSYYGFYAKDKSNIYFLDALVAGADASFHFILDNSGQQTGYAKDSRHIYNAFTAQPINGNADPDTFVVLNEWYAKDSQKVYSVIPEVVNDGIMTLGTPISGADPKSFSLVTNQPNYDAKDANHLYYHAKVMK